MILIRSRITLFSKIFQETFSNVLEVRNLPSAKDCVEEEPRSVNTNKEKPSEEKALSLQQKEEKRKDGVEVKAEFCENTDEFNKEHTKRNNTDTKGSQNAELKTVVSVESFLNSLEIVHVSVSFAFTFNSLH